LDWHWRHYVSAAGASSSPKTAIGYELNNNGSGGTIVSTFDGQPAVVTDVLLQYTLVGDTNLNATVNFGDLLTLAQNYNKTGTIWTTGDFNYDGTTNFADLLGLAQNYNKGLH